MRMYTCMWSYMKVQLCVRVCVLVHGSSLFSDSSLVLSTRHFSAPLTDRLKSIFIFSCVYIQVHTCMRTKGLCVWTCVQNVSGCLCEDACVRLCRGMCVHVYMCEGMCGCMHRMAKHVE